MNRTIALDHEVGFAAIKVSDVIADLVLPPEFVAKESPISQQPPQHLFCGCLIFAKLAGQRFLS
jgi:hypothetical protein